MIVYVAVAALTLGEPGEVAVRTHWPAARAVMVDPLRTQGPVSDRTTVAPDWAVAVKTVFEPAWTLIGSPGFQGAPAWGATVITSEGLAGWMFTVWLEVPLKPPVELENSVRMV